MMRRFSQFLSLVGLAMSLGACHESQLVGYLRVNAPTHGTYEIYRIASSSPLHFTSEQLGEFNKPVALAAGSYFVLSDCSSETVIIHADRTKTLVAHQVNFQPPVTPVPEDKFIVQCDRFTETRSRQQITNRYSLNILAGDRDLLVGMVPIQVKLPHHGDDTQPTSLSYRLAGLRVASYEGMDKESRFFVSPAKDQLAVTETQRFGNWQFLLPSNYVLEVNGTSMPVTLKEGDLTSITPALLKISVNSEVNLDLASQISGNPLYVELNNGHLLNINEIYPALPGVAKLRLSGSTKAQEVQLIEGELSDQKAKSVLVHNFCSPWDWTCLGNIGVFLYEDGKNFAFTQAITDVPILYFEDNVLLSLEGSRGIQYRLPKDADNTSLRLGKVNLQPKVFHRAGQVTDLSRIEAGQDAIRGSSLDLVFDQPTIMPLIAGNYNLAQYVTITASEGERKVFKRPLKIRANEIQDMPFFVFVSEKKANSMAANDEQKKKQETRRILSLYGDKYLPVIPLRYQ